MVSSTRPLGFERWGSHTAVTRHTGRMLAQKHRDWPNFGQVTAGHRKSQQGVGGTFPTTSLRLGQPRGHSMAETPANQPATLQQDASTPPSRWWCTGNRECHSVPVYIHTVQITGCGRGRIFFVRASGTPLMGWRCGSNTRTPTVRWLGGRRRSGMGASGGPFGCGTGCLQMGRGWRH